MTKRSGFTLIELLIAIAIFAVVAMIGVRAVYTVVQAHHKVLLVQQHLQKMLVATSLLRQDVSQMVDRSVRDTSGSALPGILMRSSTALEFTRRGHLCLPLDDCSTFLRVAYFCKGHALYRQWWPVVDRAAETKARQMKLLDDLQTCQLRFVDDTGQYRRVWQTAVHQGASQLPRAIEWTFATSHEGQIMLLLPIAARGYQHA